MDFQELPKEEEAYEDIDTEEAPPPQRKKKENAKPQEEKPEPKVPIELRIEEEETPQLARAIGLPAKPGLDAQHAHNRLREGRVAGRIVLVP